MLPRRAPVSFWSELKRRRVIKVGVTYLLVGLAVGEGADIFLPQLGAPTWVVPVILALLALGFPLAVVLAWAYDVTPEGIVRDSAPTAAVDPAVVPGNLPEPVVVEPQPAAPPAPTGPTTDDRPSVAVLPLANMSGDPENEFFSDGVTEDILTHLTRVKGLRVTSRTSVMQYKGTTKTMPEVARELGVDSVLEGSIRVAGGQVRITVQLIDAASDDHLWAESYDRSLEDVFAVQSEVAESVASALRAELSPGEIEQIHTKPTENIEAYTLCLRGQEALNTWAPPDLDRAVKHFEAALRLDPDYARAYAGLALVLAVTPVFSGRGPADFHERMERATLRALELDDRLPLAHVAHATLLWNREYDWSGAEAAFARAVELAPRDPHVRVMQAMFLIAQERFDEAVAALDDLDAGPLEMMTVRAVKAMARYTDGRPDEALELIEAPLQDFPDRFVLHFHKGNALGAAGRYAEAVEAYDHALVIDPEMAMVVALRAIYLARLGRDDEARSEVARLEKWEGRDPPGPYAMAIAYMALGEVERALDMMEQAVTEREFLAPYVRAIPRWRPLRAHPRFQAILQSMWPDHGPFEVEEPS